MTMLNYLLLIVLPLYLSVSSCKKVVEEQQKKVFLTVMTEGQWHVENYSEGTIDITRMFSGYQFKFEADGTVAGITGAGSAKGTWIGDIENYTITAHFPGAADPLNKLNGVWKIIDTEAGYVKAETTTDKGRMLLQLRKS